MPRAESDEINNPEIAYCPDTLISARTAGSTETASTPASAVDRELVPLRVRMGHPDGGPEPVDVDSSTRDDERALDDRGSDRRGVGRPRAEDEQDGEEQGRADERGEVTTDAEAVARGEDN